MNGGDEAAAFRAEPASERERRGLRAVLALAALFGVVSLVLTCARRAGAAFPLEWMEGASLQHALWLARGQLPYAAPSAELIAFLYPPLAYLPWALLAAIAGPPSLPVARVVSLLCTAGTLLLIARAGTRLSGERSAGWFAAGSFAVGFGYTGAFLDLVRVDAAFVLLLVLAAERLSAGRHGAALLALAAAGLAKQHGLVLLALVAALLLARDLRAHARAVLGVGLGLGAVLLGLQLASDGWFGRYVFQLPGAHGLEPGLLLSFALVDLLLYVPVLSVGAAYLLIARWRADGPTQGWRALQPLDALLLGAVAVSALGRAHPGGEDNVRLPAFALLCICSAAPLAARVVNARRQAARRWLCAAVLAQLLLLWQPPSAHAPPPGSQRAWQTLSGALQHCAQGGRSVALDHALLTGTPFVHTMALSDLRMAGGVLGAAGTRALLAALEGKNAPAALAVGASFPELERVLERRYERCAVVLSPRLATGYQPGRREEGYRVQVVYARRPFVSDLAPRAAYVLGKILTIQEYCSGFSCGRARSRSQIEHE